MVGAAPAALLAAVAVLLVCLAGQARARPATWDTVWTYWGSGFAPEIVRRCWKNWERVGGCRDIRVLNRWTAARYLPRERLKRYAEITAGSEANRSDLIRLHLLKTYGGTWIDASVFMTCPLAEWLPRKPFCFRADRSSPDGGETCLDTILIRAPPMNRLISEWLDGCERAFADRPLYEKEYAAQREIIGHNRDYLVAFAVSMPLDKSGFELASAEKGPYRATEEAGWDRPEAVCSHVDCGARLVKLWSEPRKACAPATIPLSRPCVN